MSKKTQPSNMTTAYGSRFSQQDLTDPKENQQPQPLHTPEYEEGDLEFAREKGITSFGQNPNRNVPNSTVPKAKKVA